MGSNIDLKNKKAPFGNALSFSDGGLGTPFFYLTIKDEATANFSLYDPRTSLTVSQYALGTCDMLDPQEPACVKVTLSGTVRTSSSLIFLHFPELNFFRLIFVIKLIDISCVELIAFCLISPCVAWQLNKLKARSGRGDLPMPRSSSGTPGLAVITSVFDLFHYYYY